MANKVPTAKDAESPGETEKAWVVDVTPRHIGSVFFIDMYCIHNEFYDWHGLC